MDGGSGQGRAQINHGAPHMPCLLYTSYTQFYRTLKKIIDRGEIGDVITFNANEGVGAWHFAHSFVRGHCCLLYTSC